MMLQTVFVLILSVTGWATTVEAIVTSPRVGHRQAVRCLRPWTSSSSSSSVGSCSFSQISKPSTYMSPQFMSPPMTVSEPSTAGFIDTELRGAAMRLHTKSQAPREGQAAEKTPAKPFVPKHQDYLAFLVDSLHVYEALEDVVEQLPEMACFRNTGLERTTALKADIDFMVKEYSLNRPEVGQPGKEYAEEIRLMALKGAVPDLICHYYNFYFAHTAGGRMIGKQMSALLLENKTLEFYKWDGNLAQIKAAVKADIEAMVMEWTREEKDKCVDQTEAAFRGGGALNGYIDGSH